MRVLLALLAVIVLLAGPALGERLGLPQYAAGALGIVPAMFLVFPITMPRAPLLARIVLVIVAALVVLGIQWLL
jgi:hypothetical protein